MQTLNIVKTNRTPEIYYDPATAILEISGRSIPENSLQFFQPLFDWAETFRIQKNQRILNVIFKLEYFNTSSSKCILDLLRKLERIKENDKEVFIKWYYDPRDEDMEEAGKDFQDMMELNIELIAL